MEEVKRRNSLNESEYIEYLQKEKKDRAKLAIIIAGGILIIAALILIFANSESHYVKGVKYLNQKQYTEALSEFQRVDTSDKDFSKAQSKINYIKGLDAFNNGLKTEAKSYLVRVDTTDEYYHDAQLMIEKIDLANKQGDIDADTESGQFFNRGDAFLGGRNFDHYVGAVHFFPQAARFFESAGSVERQFGVSNRPGVASEQCVEPRRPRRVR